jgi:predicted ATPase
LASSAQNLALLQNLLGLKTPEGVLTGLDGTLVGLWTRDLLLQLLQARCRLSPVVMLLEDLHWTDSASEELLSKIVGTDKVLSLMILHTRRPEYAPPWSNQPLVTSLTLEPLSPRETQRIVQGCLGVHELPEDLGRLVADKAEGNALFAEEIASFLLERGIVRRTASLQFDLQAVAAALPGSVQSLLTARVDRLSPDARTLLQAAAVIGRRFDAELLAFAADAANEVEPALATMQALDLVRREKSGDYIFKHALVRDALYDSMLSAQRSALHLKVADEIERRRANRLIEVAEQLAHHYTRTPRADLGALETIPAVGS